MLGTSLLLAAPTVQSKNPILPAVDELVWGGLSFVVLCIIMIRFAFPAVKKSMDARTERIRTSLASAEQASTDARSVLEEYQRQLADAKNESNRIIEEARQTADSLRRDLTAKATAEATEIRQRATADIQSAKERALAELRGQISQLTIDLAERVVKRNLDRESNMRLIDDYIASVGAGKSSAAERN